MRTVLLLSLMVLASWGISYHEYAAPIIEEVNSQNTTWTAGHNSYFDGMSIEDMKHLMGSRREPEWMRLPLKDIEPLQAIPATFDARTQWPNCQSIKEVRDQSNCGSCWAFGSSEAFSDRICIASGQTSQTRVSTLDTMSCCGSSCGDGCDGGYPQSAWSWFKSKGAVTGDLYNTTGYCMPYSFPPCAHHEPSAHYPNCTGPEYPTPKCNKSCISGYNVTYSNDKKFAKSAYSIPQKVAAIQTEIMTYGPVTAAFEVYADFPTYKSGVYKHVTGDDLGGHAIKIIGWGVQNNTPYWLVANSWNEDWGLSGFFMIARGTDECGIEEQVCAGIPA